jgi:hypothetical protein
MGILQLSFYFMLFERFLVVYTAHWIMSLSAATTEALGLLRGLEFLERIGCSFKVSIGSDSLQLIQCCNSMSV